MLPERLPCTRVDPGPRIWAPSALASEGSVLPGRSGAPPPWLLLSWAPCASLSRHELPPSPPDVSPSLPGVSPRPRRRVEGPLSFPLLRRPRLTVRSPFPGSLLSPRLSPGPCEPPCLPWLAWDALLQRRSSSVGFPWPPALPSPPVASSSGAGLVLRAGLPPPLEAPSALADPDSRSGAPALPGRARRWGAFPLLPPITAVPTSFWSFCLVI